MHAQEGDNHSISHTTTVDHVDRTRITKEQSECIGNYAFFSLMVWCESFHGAITEKRFPLNEFKSVFEPRSYFEKKTAYF